MSNVTKKSKREKIKTQITRLLTQLATLNDKETVRSIGDYFDRRNRSRIYVDRQRQITNIKKRIDLLNRKLDILKS